MPCKAYRADALPGMCVSPDALMKVYVKDAALFADDFGGLFL